MSVLLMRLEKVMIGYKDDMLVFILCVNSCHINNISI